MNHTRRHFGSKIPYKDRNTKSQEYFNGTRLQALMADYGYSGTLMPDDSHGPDFLFYRQADGMMMAVQLKGRLWWAKDYLGKELHIACPVQSGNPDGDWWIYPHDETQRALAQIGKTYFDSKEWTEKGKYHTDKPAADVVDHMEQYRLRRGEA